ncbi:MAG: SNF2-related protein, partial [Massilibacteroides sp.]|nr:SNF2-related protein [Massilibacteroides sp.]
MEIINNRNVTLKDDFLKEIKKGSKLSIAASTFSIYAFQVLKDKLKDIDELRFCFTSPTFTTEKAAKEKREFYIPRLERERNLYGSEFEVKLRNELTQKVIARECADWIREKVQFKSNITKQNMGGFVILDNLIYCPVEKFSTDTLGCERGKLAYSMINKSGQPNTQEYLTTFNSFWNDKEMVQDVTDQVLNNITAAYKENSPDFLYFVILYNIFNEFLEDVSEDELPNEATGFKDTCIWKMLYNFQKDAALSIINKLEKYNGCILADSVGLGKTFTSLAVIKYYEERNKSVLVLCPKKLSNNWNTFKGNYINNPIQKDKLRYDVLFHTDLTRTRGSSNGIELNLLNWGNYDLVVIDESHNFRNGGNLYRKDDEKDNRYITLLKKVIRAGVKTKVLMLSATPVNNRFVDLKNQLQLAYEGDSSLLDVKLNTSHSINDIFRQAQTAFNKWSKYDPNNRTTNKLLDLLNFDFFELLDSVTIARSRKHIQKYYDTKDIGTFPTRLKPLSLSPHLTDLKDAINYNEIYEKLMNLNLSLYTPSLYILPSKQEKYAELYNDNKVNINFTQANREKGIRRLTAICLMKRLESSVYSFGLTLNRIDDKINSIIDLIENYNNQSNQAINLTNLSNIDDFDEDDQNIDDLFYIGKKVKIDIADMDYISWKQDLKKDAEILELIFLMIKEITPKHDSKLQKLLEIIKHKIENPINEENKKVLIFTAFSDTAKYLYEHVSTYVKQEFNLDTAMVTGSISGKTSLPQKGLDLNSVLTYFSPIAKGRHLIKQGKIYDLDILIATDCISEGQNLQDCDYLINYDIHWNPVRIIQRFGRIDRIGSKNKTIQLVNLWPDISLDEYIHLKSKIETRMKIVDLAATADDNMLTPE